MQLYYRSIHSAVRFDRSVQVSGLSYVTFLSQHLEERTTLRNVLPPVVQWVVSVGTGPGILAEHLAYHFTIGTRPSGEKQTEKESESRASRGVASEQGTEPDIQSKKYTSFV